MSEINREYKDRLFVFIFGREENRKWTLSLYNAVNGTDYTDENAIEITTMSDAVYMGMRNDVSFIITEFISLFEQQSTYNPNMPVRQLMYLGRLYDKYIDATKQNLYGKRQIELPVPKLVTFYNGKDDIPDKILKLSDSFSKNAELSDVEVNVRLININLGNNKELLESCRPLKEYSWFVDGVRNKKDQGKLSLEEAVDHTIDEMPEDFQIREFLIGNRAEVKSMCLTEYNEAETMQMFKEEGREEGRAEGIALGTVKRDEEKITEMLCRGKTVEEIVDFCGYPDEQVRKISDRLSTTERR
jgi:predicted transposase YdaD